MYKFFEYQDNKEFFLAIQDILKENFFANNVVDGVRQKNNPYLACQKFVVTQDDKVMLYAYHEPNRHFLLGTYSGSVDEQAVKCLLDNFAERNVVIPSMFAETELFNLVRKFYCNSKRVFVPIDDITCMVCNNATVFNAEGNMRLATERDLHVLTCFMLAMQKECNLGNATYEQFRKNILTNLAYYKVWEKDGEIVSCLRTLQRGDGVAISNVYTPDNQRRHGYSKALVSQTTQHELQSTPYCTLNVSDVNPISNHIYTEIGYKYVVKQREGRFVERE